MSILVLLLVGSAAASPVFDVRTVGSATINVEATLPVFSAEDSNSAYACLVPAPGGRVPTIDKVKALSGNDEDVSVSLGQVAVAGGVSVVPLVLERRFEDAARVSVRLSYDRSLRTDTDEHGRTRTGNAMAALVKTMWGVDEGTDGSGEGQAGYLIVVPDDFYNNVLPLAAWKERKGFTVWVKKTSETGTTKEQIKAYIQTAYSTWSPPPSYVLLVGAISKIPAFINPGTPCVTDHTYACVDGNDYLADLFVGRLPAANASELDVMVAKTLGYEMTPYVADTTWYHRALMVGTSYQEGSGTSAVTALVTKRVIRERLLERGFTQIDTVFYPPTPSGHGPVDSAVNRGVLYVNGRGWGNSYGWKYPAFEMTDVSALANGWKLPVVTSIYCGTGNYGFDPCFGSMWLKVGTPSSPKGAVAFWGSSYTATSTRWNNCMDYGIYQAIFDWGVRTCGPAMYLGKMAQFTNFPLPADSWELRSYFHVYNLLGDPSLEMWTGVPRTLDVSYPSTFSVGASSFDVVVRDGSGQPVRDAVVCLHKTNEVHSVELTDASGRARFAISTSTADTMRVTVTGANLLPHVGSSLATAQGVFVGHLSHDPSSVGPGGNASISVTLKNFGASLTANAVSATLRALDSSALVTDSVKACGDIAPGGTAVAAGFGVTVAPACTSGQQIPFQLAVRSGDSTWLSAFEMPVAGPTLKTGGYTVHDPNGVLDPGESAELSVLVRNSGAGAAVGMSGVLRSLNPAVQVVDSNGTYGTIGTNDSAENTGDRFQVRASGGIGVGRRFSLRLVMRGSGGFEQHWDFPITVGKPTAASPLGPDRHGYYAYDDTDAGYPEQPAFNWVEIDPGQGGSGTRVGLVNDTAIPVSLPFTFRFYGRDYNTVSVCDNGYIAMDSQWLGEVYNWHIPSPMGPDGIVAPFWDDFRADTMGAGVFTFDDAVSHRFIIEWSRCIHVHGYRPPSLADTQSFQLMLYDPYYSQTATGDGSMLAQYLAVKNDDSTPDNGHNFATVGIQSADHSDGLEYTFAGSYPAAAATVGPNRAIRFTTNPPDTFTAVREETGDRGRGTDVGFRVQPNPARQRAIVYLPWVQEARGEKREAIGELRVFDVMGREVRILAVGTRGVVEWDLRDRSGRRVPAGVYYFEVRSQKVEGRSPTRESRRVVVVDE